MIRSRRESNTPFDTLGHNDAFGASRALAEAAGDFEVFVRAVCQVSSFSPFRAPSTWIAVVSLGAGVLGLHLLFGILGVGNF